MDKPLLRSEEYSEYIVDTAIVGISSISGDLFCIQFLSNKPSPYVENVNTEAGNTEVKLSIGNLLVHECTLYLGKRQLESIYKSIGSMLHSNDEDELSTGE